MKKFIAKLLIYFLLLSCFVIVINYIYIKLNKSDDGTKKFEDIPTDIEICNLGSSHGVYGYNYEDMNNEYICFNFALVSQSLSYDYRLLKNYQKNISENAVIFITVSYFSFFGIDEIDTDDFEVKNRRYYRILPSNLIKGYNLFSDIAETFPSLYASREMFATVVLRRSWNNFDDLDTIWEKTAYDVDVPEDANEACLRHIVIGKRDKAGKLIYNDEEISALYAIIAICREIGAIPILVTTPFLSEYTDKVQEDTINFLDKFYGVIDQVVEDTGVYYYDYSMDERFKNDYSLFMNSDHLNKEGARIFTGILIDEVLN